jgi:phospholipase A2
MVSPQIKPELIAGYAKQRGIIGWPIGVGWPRDSSAKELGRLEKAEATTPEEAQTKLSEAKADPKPDEPSDPTTSKYGLGHVNIWIGTTAQRTSSDEPPPSKQMPLTADDSWQLDTSDDGVMLIYCPFLPNARVPGLDPETTEFMSTWNFEYKPEEVDATVALAEANFEEGRERIRRAVKAVWLRKRETRLAREKEEGRLLMISDRQKMFREW